MKSALISVSDKTGVESLASRLEKLGYRILSTGGTASALRKAGINVTDVSEITGFPECLDGRVKTLHPAVHGGILAMRSKPEHMEQLKKLGIDTIDIVVINLYPFKATISKKDVSLEEAIENIDIGGPTMLRAAAKNWQDVCVITDVNEYDTLIEALENGGPDKAQKFAWAQKIFEHTANYDSMIARYLAEKEGLDFPSKISFTYEKVQDLRYGENPHQKAAFYKEGLGTEGTLAAAKQLHGKELSFNNINDTAAAISMLNEFAGTPAAVAVKHANPCGVGIGDTLFEAYTRAYDSDPVSIFGGIVALNRKVDPETAKKLSEIFLEVIVAPEYSEEALAILGKKKNIRLLQLEGCGEGGYKDGGAEPWKLLRGGRDLTIAAYGTMVSEALSAAELLESEGISAEIIKLGRVLPLEAEPVMASAKRTGALVVAEEVCSSGCIGGRILAEAGPDAGFRARLLNLGEGIVGQGGTEKLRALCGIDAAGIAAAAKELRA